ncbi:MAG: glycosyltransferase family 9 protein [Candidatus Omnitrophota bacterium]
MGKRILIINPFGIGDVLFSTPLVSVLKKADSKSYIAYICNIRTKEILETNTDIDEVFVFDRGEYRALWKRDKVGSLRKIIDFWMKIKKRNIDIVVDLSLGKEYAFLSWLIGIKERIGFNYKGRGRFLTGKTPFFGFNDKPVAEYYLDLICSRIDLSRFKGIKTTLITLKEDKEYIDSFLKTSGIGHEDVLIGIAPGGGVSFGKEKGGMRRWPADKFSLLADKLIEKFNAKVVFIWGPGEEGLVEDIKNSMERKTLIAPRTTVRQMAELCKRLKLFICSEGGPLHIASSQGIKTVSIFGPVDESVYGAYPSGLANISVTKEVDCRPCYKRFKVPECSHKRCLETLSVDDVFDKVLHMIE